MDVARWLKPHTVLLSVAGSHSYGTAREGSDVDVRGVCVAPNAYRNGFLHHFEQADSSLLMETFREEITGVGLVIPEGENIDGVVYSHQKFFKLAADCNPNILEALFVKPEHRIIQTPLGEELISFRDDFLSKRAVYTYRGYAVSQLKRLDRHRQWLLSPPKAPPLRVEFDLPEKSLIRGSVLQRMKNEIQKKIDEWEIDFLDMSPAGKIYITEQIESYLSELNAGLDERYIAAGRVLGLSEEALSVIRSRRRYDAALSEWRHYQGWLQNRNPKRAQMEANLGFDGKHALHMVRLLRCCYELLSEGVLRVFRDDAKELLGITQGEWSYDKLISYAAEMDAKILELEQTSSLPKKPNLEKLDQLCQMMTEAM